MPPLAAPQVFCYSVSMSSLKTVVAVLISCLGFSAAYTADYFVDPVNGDPNGDGSRGNPWRSLQEVAESGLIQTDSKRDGRIRGGDTIFLLSGDHGAFVVNGARNSNPITVAAAPGETPRLHYIVLRGASNWMFRGLSISLSYAPEYKKRTMVRFRNNSRYGSCSDITIENCEIFSVPDISSWTADDWRQNAGSGVITDGARCRVINNDIRNTRFGIISSGNHAHVASNRITNFSGDGIRGLGDHSVYEYNLIENAFKVDDNHDDGFQSWSTGPAGPGSGVVRGVTLRGNTIINNRDPGQPLKTKLQGIGCFDGMFEDWVVENNVICVDHYHGITLMGALNTRITNNTVVDTFSGGPGPAWIRISPHKSGTDGANNLVSNNLASNYNVEGLGTRLTHNRVVNDPSKFFVDPRAFDFRLKADAPAIDKAQVGSAPPLDAGKRPRDAQPDQGAYEYLKEQDS